MKPQINTFPACDPDPRWYAVYLHPRREMIVAKHLALRQIEYYLPLYRTVHTWKNRCTRHLELPLFPGYLFVRITSAQRSSVLSVPGVVQLVGQPGRPAPLPDGEMDALRRGLCERNPKPHPALCEGERVRIHSGALAGLEGTLQRGADGPRVVISLDIIAQGASVEVDWSELSAVNTTAPVGKVSPLLATAALASARPTVRPAAAS